MQEKQHETTMKAVQDAENATDEPAGETTGQTLSMQELAALQEKMKRVPRIMNRHERRKQAAINRRSRVNY